MAARQKLRELLPKDCCYVPSDICDRGPGTIVCDLDTRPLPGFPDSDVVVFAGVLEYLTDVPGLIAHLRRSTRSIIVAYICARDESLLESLRRRSSAWINDYTKEELIRLFSEAGFTCESAREWRPLQYLFRFASDTRETRSRTSPKNAPRPAPRPEAF